MCNKADGEAHHTKLTHDLINYSRGRNKIGLLLHYCSVSKKLQIDYFGEKIYMFPVTELQRWLPQWHLLLFSFTSPQVVAHVCLI